ncbi:MAG: thiamine pyrophosphate-dependent dehydrogenase E1 component subunit alpha, partial [Spirochaetia bacterium]|nr:thiamine pyrophosphate-dependent dehydrogenase E1 component subunit alpha [Spirochaetia bacterium]
MKMTQSRTTTTEASERTKPTLKHYSVMSRIRITEQLLLQSFSKGLLRGTTHTYLGQEAIASAALSFLGEDDIVVSNHRCHGHFLAYCEDHRLLLSEIVGSVEGASKGVGGSQHIHHRNFYSNGILGGMVPAAAGMAFAEKIRGTGAISVCFLGDGTLGEGIVYESLNMASLWDIPILYVIENNGIAQSTPISLNLAGSMAARIRAFGIETAEIESNDIGELLPCFEKAFEHVRR